MSHPSRSGAAAIALAAVLAAGGSLAGCGAGGPGGDCAERSGSSADTGRPDRLAIDHDDYLAKHVGHTADGRQFFLTRPFDPGTYGDGNAREFVALYVFDRDGRLLEAEIDAFDSSDPDASADAQRVHRSRLGGLGEVRFDRIEVRPFAVERFGTTFGLVARAPEGDDGIWWVTAEPGDYMAFAAPWDCGRYDT